MDFTDEILYSQLISKLNSPEGKKIFMNECKKNKSNAPRFEFVDFYLQSCYKNANSIHILIETVIKLTVLLFSTYHKKQSKHLNRSNRRKIRRQRRLVRQKKLMKLPA